jgi:hypothetical protein
VTASLFARPSDPGTVPGPAHPAATPVDDDVDVDDVVAEDVDVDAGRTGPLGDLLGGPGRVPVDATLDIGAIALATILGVVVALDLAVDGRWPLAVAFFAWAPGWAIVRATSIRTTSLTVLVSVGLSVSMTMLVGQALIAWGWVAWRAAVVLVCVAVATVLARDLRRIRP